MGIFDWLFGSDDPAPVPTGTTTVTNKLPPYVEEGWKKAIGEAERLTSQPYQPYDFARIADFTPEQQAAFQMAEGNLGVLPDMYQGIMGDINQAGGPIDPTQVDRYMNPYLQGVGGQVERELQRRQATELQDIGTAAHNVGGYGGTRQAVLEAESGRNLDRNVADMYERLYSGGYDKALTGLRDDRDASMKSGIANLGATGAYGAALGGDVQSMLGIGGAQQQLTQQGLNMAYQDFLNQREYPYQQLGYYANLVQGVPNQTNQTTTETGYVNDTGNFGTLAQVGGGIYNNWGKISNVGGGIWDAVSDWLK